jgi:glycosyl transferase family 25
MRLKTPKIIILSLKSSSERRAAIKIYLNKIKKLEYIFFNAYKGESVPHSLLNKNLTKKLLGRDMSLGEIGCAYSHYMILKEFSKDEIIVVLEDDVRLYKDFEKVLNMIFKSELNKSNLIFLNSGFNFFPRFKTKISLDNKYSLYKAAGSTWGTYGMVIHKNIAKKILSFYSDGIILPADYYGRKFCDSPIDILSVFPPILNHPHVEGNPKNSIIGLDRYKKNKYKREIKTILSNIKNRVLQWF